MKNYLSQMYPEQRVNEYPIRLCTHLVENYLSDYNTDCNRFLELGCGKKTHLKIFSRLLPGEFHGVDLLVDDEITDGIETKSCNLEKEPLPYPDEHFDVVFSKSVIEHIYNTENFMSEVCRVLRPGGCVVLLTPDWHTQMKNFYDDPTHVRPFTQRSIYALLKMHGMKNVRSEQFMQLPITWRFPFLQIIISTFGRLLPESFKWKNSIDRNTKDRKFVRFAKEKMILGIGNK